MIETIQNIDFAILDAIQGIRTSALDAVMEFITHLEDAGMIWIAIALVMLFIKKYRPCGAAAADVLVKKLFERFGKRPAEENS